MSRQPDSAPGAVTEFRHGWRALTAATVGIGVGVAVLPFYTVGLFIPELEAEFGWSRGQLSLLQLVGSLVTVLTAPLVGLLVDRLGVRIPATFSLVVLGLAYFLLAQSGPSFITFLTLWGLMYLLAASSTAVAFTRTVNERFDRARGLALGIALGGAGVVAFAVPRLLGTTIAEDWRLSFRILGAAILIGAAIVVLLMPRRSHASAPAGRTAARDSLAAVLRDPLFLRLALIFITIALAVGGMTVHLVPLLRDAGVSAGGAASSAALVGVSVIIGRVIVGLLVDRLFAPFVAAGVMVMASLGYLALVLGGPAFAAAAALGIGLALGAEVDIIGYLTARYYGVVKYGRVFGLFYAIFTIGIGISPVMIAEIRSATGSYTAALMVCVGLMLSAALMLLFLPRFPAPASVVEPGASTAQPDSVRAADA